MDSKTFEFPTIEEWSRDTFIITEEINRKGRFVYKIKLRQKRPQPSQFNSLLYDLGRIYCKFYGRKDELNRDIELAYKKELSIARTKFENKVVKEKEVFYKV